MLRINSHLQKYFLYPFPLLCECGSGCVGGWHCVCVWLFIYSLNVTVASCGWPINLTIVFKFTYNPLYLCHPFYPFHSNADNTYLFRFHDVCTLSVSLHPGMGSHKFRQWKGGKWNELKSTLCSSINHSVHGEKFGRRELFHVLDINSTLNYKHVTYNLQHIIM